MRKRLRKKLARKRAKERLAAVWLRALRQCPEGLTRSQLCNLAYLVDVTAYRALGRPITGMRWIKVPGGVEPAWPEVS